jgi:hypothetical protein
LGARAITLDVAVGDMPAATRSYGTVFAAVPEVDASGTTALQLRDGFGLRIVEEDGHAPGRGDAAHYQRGRTPRLELRVDDVDAALSRWVGAGARVCSRLVPGPDGVLRRAGDGEHGCVYAHVIDPFGHLWALSR